MVGLPIASKSLKAFICTECKTCNTHTCDLRASNLHSHRAMKEKIENLARVRRQVCLLYCSKKPRVCNVVILAVQSPKIKNWQWKKGGCRRAETNVSRIIPWTSGAHLKYKLQTTSMQSTSDTLTTTPTATPTPVSVNRDRLAGWLAVLSVFPGLARMFTNNSYMHTYMCTRTCTYPHIIFSTLCTWHGQHTSTRAARKTKTFANHIVLFWKCRLSHPIPY